VDLAWRRIQAPVWGVLLVVLAACSDRSAPHVAAPPSSSSAPTSSSAVPAAPPTSMRTFVAFRPDGTAAVSVSRTRTGRCWTTSITVPERGVYRCFAANQILDPCFTAPRQSSPKAVLCVTDPWSVGEWMTLTARLPSVPTALKSTRPWALQLANGFRCVAVTGTVPEIAGVPLGYRCEHNIAAGLTAAHGPTMRARYGPADGTSLQTVAVAVAWRG